MALPTVKDDVHVQCSLSGLWNNAVISLEFSDPLKSPDHLVNSFTFVTEIDRNKVKK